jgi:hypothetical protein
MPLYFGEKPLPVPYLSFYMKTVPRSSYFTPASTACVSVRDARGNLQPLQDVQTPSRSVRLQVLTAASMKIRAFWNISPCSLVVIDRRFRGAYYLHHQDNNRPDDGGSTHRWTSIYYNEITRRNIPECSESQSRSVYELTIPGSDRNY